MNSANIIKSTLNPKLQFGIEYFFHFFKNIKSLFPKPEFWKQVFKRRWIPACAGMTGILFILLSCVSPQHYPPCINEKMHELTISWGDHDIATGKIEGFRLDAMGNLYEFYRASDTSVYVDKLKRTLPDSLYCHINKLVVKEIMKAQTLNSAIDTERFVEYRNPEAKAVMRASWNPKFETKGNKGFLELYDYLSRIVGDIK